MDLLQQCIEFNSDESSYKVCQIPSAIVSILMSFTEDVEVDLDELA